MIDLPAEYIDMVKQILAVLPEVEVRVFGSRVNGKAHTYSDLDLALVAPERIPYNRLGTLKDAFAESDLPIQVDILDWHAIDPTFQKVIERHYEVLRYHTQYE